MVTKRKAATKTKLNAKAKAKRRGAKKRSAPQAAPEAGRIRIRMYRLGVGDCFLVSFPRSDAEPFRILIDCGVHMAQPGGTERIREVAQDIIEETKGFVDVVVGTHEHWDHISGFGQAEDLFSAGLSANEVWLAWTEDDDDELASKIAVKRKRYQSMAVASAAAGRLAALGVAPPGLEGLLGFYGPGAGKKLKAAGDAMLRLATTRRFLKPGEEPIEIEGVEARIFVLGPPRNEDLLKKDLPSKKNSEVYEFGRHAMMAAQLGTALSPKEAPFDGRFAIPLQASIGDSFFSRSYWANEPTEIARHKREEVGQGWRRIDNTWLDAATSLALDLDSDTNNTSLVLAIELGPKNESGPVVLFAADAQVGNWLGWERVSWTYCGRKITAADLLARTIIYKVGHHASHNATLKVKGLELMTNLALALVPTDEVMADKVGWGTLPWPPLLRALRNYAKSGVIRTDQERGWIKSAAIESAGLYYDIRF